MPALLFERHRAVGCFVRAVGRARGGARATMERGSGTDVGGRARVRLHYRAVAEHASFPALPFERRWAAGCCGRAVGRASGPSGWAGHYLFTLCSLFVHSLFTLCSLFVH